MYFATLLDVVVLVVVVVDVLHPFSPFDVLNPFHPFDVWNPLHPFDAVDVRFGANLLGLAHLDDFDVLDVGFPYDMHDVLSFVAAQPPDVHPFVVVALDVRGLSGENS